MPCGGRKYCTTSHQEVFDPATVSNMNLCKSKDKYGQDLGVPILKVKTVSFLLIEEFQVKS